MLLSDGVVTFPKKYDTHELIREIWNLVRLVQPSPSLKLIGEGNIFSAIWYNVLASVHVLLPVYQMS